MIRWLLLPHASTLVSPFCIPPTGSLGFDLPGPGSISLPGNAQFTSPSGAFLTE
jgi:hypothetical protein